MSRYKFTRNEYKKGDHAASGRFCRGLYGAARRFNKQHARDQIMVLGF